MRGGGGGHALVTHLELRLDRVPELFGGQIVWPAAAAPEVFGAWRDWTERLPQEMSSSVGVITLPQVLTVFQEYEHLLLGFIIIVSMIFMRDGIVPTLSRALAKRTKA